MYLFDAERNQVLVDAILFLKCSKINQQKMNTTLSKLWKKQFAWMATDVASKVRCCNISFIKY